MKKSAYLDLNLQDIALRAFSRQGIKGTPTLKDAGQYLVTKFPHPNLTSRAATSPTRELLRQQRLNRVDHLAMHGAGRIMLKADRLLDRIKFPMD